MRLRGFICHYWARMFCFLAVENERTTGGRRGKVSQFAKQSRLIVYDASRLLIIVIISTRSLVASPQPLAPPFPPRYIYTQWMREQLFTHINFKFQHSNMNLQLTQSTLCSPQKLITLLGLAIYAREQKAGWKISHTHGSWLIMNELARGDVKNEREEERGVGGWRECWKIYFQG